uniref:Uncharacterized protein n=1 Tax=viral metagenome TaxID=1070528 RepID=A0A6C0KM08_9ZZZZ
METRDSFGYEQEDGSILYTITNSQSFDKNSISILFREIPPFTNLEKKAASADDYFSNTEELTKWRILYKGDNTTAYKFIGINHIFVFNPKF